MINKSDQKSQIIDTLDLLNQQIYYYSPNKNKNKKINFNTIKLKNAIRVIDEGLKIYAGRQA